MPTRDEMLTTLRLLGWKMSGGRTFASDGKEGYARALTIVDSVAWVPGSGLWEICRYDLESMTDAELKPLFDKVMSDGS